MRGVRRVAPTVQIRHADQRLGLGDRKQAAVGLLVARRRGIGLARLKPPPLGGTGCDRQRSRLDETAVDLLALGDRGDLVDRVVGRAQRPRGAIGIVPQSIGGPAAGQSADRPAAVASRGAKAGDLALDHHDAQVRLERRQVVSRPEAGEPRADDRDVTVAVSRQRRPRGERTVELVEPQAPRAVGRLEVSIDHRRSTGPAHGRHACPPRSRCLECRRRVYGDLSGCRHCGWRDPAAGARPPLRRAPARRGLLSR